MRERDWAQILERGNGQFVEMVGWFRRSPKGKIYPRSRQDLLRAVAESLSAMANSGGGTTFLGMEAEGEALGIFFGERQQQIFLTHLRESFVPPFPIQVSQEEFGGKTILRLSVLPSPSTHLLKDGKCFLRVGLQNVLLPRDRVATLKERRMETWHEREVLPGSSWEDLDEDLVEEFMSRLGIGDGAEKIFHRPYGLVEYSEGKALLTRAGAYLFGKDPLRWHPRPGIDFVRFEGTEKRGGKEYNVAERVRLEQPIMRLVKEAEKWMGERIKERVLPRDLFFREKFESPSFTWKEALINAIAHRDYSLEGRAIEVWMFDDRIEVRSPGRLPGPVKIQQIQRKERVHYSRNPLITRVLTDAGIMKSLGEGLPRVFQEMGQHGLNPPQWEEGENFCCFIFRNTPLLDESTLAWLKQFRDYSLNPRQTRILAYARVHGGIFSSSDYQKFGVDRDEAYLEIQDLVRKGIVQPFKKHGKVYRVRELKEEDAFLIALSWVADSMREKRYFTLREAKSTGFFSGPKARNIIRRLVGEGYLSLEGKGRGSRYYPTEKLGVLMEKGKGKRDS